VNAARADADRGANLEQLVPLDTTLSSFQFGFFLSRTSQRLQQK
jgi:hypothetical protein